MDIVVAFVLMVLTKAGFWYCVVAVACANIVANGLLRGLTRIARALRAHPMQPDQPQLDEATDRYHAPTS